MRKVWCEAAVTACILTVLSWDGDLPLPGQYVKAKRGRTAYLILEVRPSRAGRRGSSAAKFICERRPVSMLQDTDIVHGWYWSKR